MKATAYFYDIYGLQGTSIAAIIWPILFILFYFIFQKKIIQSLIASFTFASFMALFYFNNFISSFIFFLGVGVLVFGTLMLANPTTKNKLVFIGGPLIIGLIALFVKFLNNKIYPNIPDKNYIGNSNFVFTQLNSYLFTIPFLLTYIFFIIYV